MKMMKSPYFAGGAGILVPNTTFVGISGAEGSYTGQAAAQYCMTKGISRVRFEYLTSVEPVLRKLQDRHIDLGIFGIVNSIGGVVEEYMPFIGRLRYDFIEILKFEVNHMLLVLPGTKWEDVDNIVSQDQALSQCLIYLAERWWGKPTQKYIDTATAAKDLSEGKLPPNSAVIASEACAKLYNLDILDTCIQDKKPNITSFVVAKPLI